MGRRAVGEEEQDGWRQVGEAGKSFADVVKKHDKQLPIKPEGLHASHWRGTVVDLAEFISRVSTARAGDHITNKCFLRLQHLAMGPSMLFRKQTRSWRLLRTPHTQSGHDQSKAFERRQQALISFTPDKSAGAARCFAEPEFPGNESPKSRTNLAHSTFTGEESQEHGAQAV